MQQFSLIHVSKILNLKPHVVRYWEQEIGLLSPKKDLNGRKYYRMQDLHLLFRLKYLIYERLFTVKGAEQKILSESQGKPADLKAEIHVLRDSLLASFYSLRQVGGSERELADHSADPIIQDGGTGGAAAEERADRDQDLIDLRRTAAQRLRNSSEQRQRVKLPVFLPHRGPYSRAVKTGEDVLHAGRAAVLTPVPGGDFAFRSLPLPAAESPLELTAGKMRRALYEYGRQPKWFLFTPSENAARLKSFLRLHRNFGLRREDLRIMISERLYLYKQDGSVPADESGRPLTAPPGLFGIFHALSRCYREANTEVLADRQRRDRFLDKLRYFALIPLHNLITEFPDPLHIGLHILYGADLSLKSVSAASAEERLYRLNGTALFSVSLLKILMRELPASALTVDSDGLDFTGKDDEIHKEELYAVRTLFADCIKYAERPFALGEEAWREASLPRRKRGDPQEHAHALMEKRKRLSTSSF